MKKNQKLEAKFSDLFQVFNPVGKQLYKLKLYIKWKSHNIFYVSLLKKDTSRKGQVNKFLKPELDIGEDKKYKIRPIRDSAI